MRNKTLKQIKALTNLVADGGSLANAMVKAGYSPKTARSPGKLTNSPVVKPIINQVVQALEEERNEIIKRLKVTRDKAKYRDLIDGLDKVTKNHQLLTGGKTENTGVAELAESLNNWIKDSQ